MKIIQNELKLKKQRPRVSPGEIAFAFLDNKRRTNQTSAKTVPTNSGWVGTNKK